MDHKYGATDKSSETLLQKKNVGATHFAIGSVSATNLTAPLAGDIAELIVFKQKEELNNASTIKRIQKHLLDEYAITHEPMLSM